MFSDTPNAHLSTGSCQDEAMAASPVSCAGHVWPVRPGPTVGEPEKPMGTRSSTHL